MVAAAALAAAPPSPDVPAPPGVSADDWPSYSRTLLGDRYAPQAEITPATVARLRPVCRYDLGRPTSFQTGPVVLDGVMYVTTDFDTIALDARTGAYRTHYPLARDDFHDWDASAAPALVTTRGGQALLLAAPKDGYPYGFDRASARRIYRVPVTTHFNVDAPLTRGSTRFCPGTQGGNEWNGPAYSPATNLVYVGTVDWCGIAAATQSASQLRDMPPGKPWSGDSSIKHRFGTFDPPSRARGWVYAVDAEAGTTRWRHQLPGPVLGAVTPTAGGLVFVGDLTGTVYAFDAGTGAERWRADVGGVVGGGIISYAVAGADGRSRQRVAVTGGMSSPIWPSPKVNAHVAVYGLD